jgi:hypothetical protein
LIGENAVRPVKGFEKSPPGTTRYRISLHALAPFERVAPQPPVRTQDESVAPGISVRKYFWWSHTAPNSLWLVDS